MTATTIPTSGDTERLEVPEVPEVPEVLLAVAGGLLADRWGPGFGSIRAGCALR